MNNRVRLAAWGGAMAMWCALAGGVPALAGPTTQSAEIDALITQLSDPDAAVVDAAKAKLIALGDASAPALERYVHARATADSVLSTIQTNKVAGPTLITLKMDNAKIEDVLAAFSKQCGYPLRPYNANAWNNNGGNRVTVSVDYQAEPFWSALMDFCKKAQICPYFDGSVNRQMLFMPAAQMGGGSLLNLPVSTGGAILPLMSTISRQRSISLGKNQSANGSFNAQIMVLFEPKVSILGYGYEPTLEEAVDDNGNSLLPKNNNRSDGMNESGRQSQINMAMNLTYPTKNVGTKIAKLRGKLRFLVGIRSESVEFTDVHADKEQTKKTPGGQRMTLQSVKLQGNDGENGRQYLAQVVVYRDGMDERKFSEVSNSLDLRLLDSKDRELQFQGVNDSSNSGAETHMTVRFYRQGVEEGAGAVGPPAKMVWTLATESKEIEVPFEFKDLPMP